MNVGRHRRKPGAGGTELQRLRWSDCNFDQLIGGEDDEGPQAANDLCEKYKPLALKIARRYRNLGISNDELCSAALLGLTVASRKFDPTRGAFGPYAKHWIKGELTRLFKPTADAMAFGRSRVPERSRAWGRTSRRSSS